MGTLKGSDFPDNKTFLEMVQKWSDTHPRTLSTESVGVHFLPLTSLIRGQDEISIDNIREEKFKDHQTYKDLTFEKGAWKLSNDEGKSLVTSNDPIDVIKGPEGYVIIDGHHDFYLSIVLGAKTIAVNVREDLSTLSKKEFWEKIKSKLYLKKDPSKNFPKTEEVLDNPNRYLATLLAMKVAGAKKGKDFEVQKVKGAKIPVWIKVNNSIPFIEFHIAKILKDAGVVYESSLGKSVPSDLIEQSRKALVQYQKTHAKGILSEIILVESLDEAKELSDPSKLKKLLQSNLNKCEDLF